MLDRAPLLFPILTLLIALGTPGCSKTEGQTSGTSATASASAATPATAATASTSAAAASAAAASASAEANGVQAAGAKEASAAAASGSASGVAAGSGSSATTAASAAANAACGTKPLPDCPLQAWMKANTNPPMAANDTAALAIALDKVATFAPPGYTNWASIAKDGAKAAKAADMTAAKAACRTCHDQYKAKYKAELRARKI